jgi:hypothetical protein
MIPDDLPTILEWFTDYFLENQKKMPMDVELNIKQVRKFFEHALKQPSLIGFMSEDGVILGEESETWFGPNKVGRGLLWYVRPKARNGILAMRLLKAFDEEAKNRGARFCRMELDNPANLKTIDGLVKKAGYEDYSKIYVRRL